jgi:cytidyltransferase-like protein
MRNALISGSFDDLRSRHVRFLEEASKLGLLRVLLWSDQAVVGLDGQSPRFPQEERLYVLESIRYVDRVILSSDRMDRDALPAPMCHKGDVWLVDEAGDNPAKRQWCLANGLDYHVIPQVDLDRFPEPPTVPDDPKSPLKKVVVTGCYDWFHSGHVRFFEEVSQLGELYVIVGHDENIRLLKGEGHPMFPAKQRRYVAGAIRFVKEALVSSGDGWMDGEPEFLSLKPDIYAVNEDGDRPEKRSFCERLGIEYRVLKRLPREGLPRRQSTTLRGF